MEVCLDLRPSGGYRLPHGGNFAVAHPMQWVHLEIVELCGKRLRLRSHGRRAPTAVGFSPWTRRSDAPAVAPQCAWCAMRPQSQAFPAQFHYFEVHPDAMRGVLMSSDSVTHKCPVKMSPGPTRP